MEFTIYLICGILYVRAYFYENSKKNTSHTLIFKNKWYEKSAIFTTKTSNNYDFIIKDKDHNFIDIIDIFDFKKKVDQTSNELIEYVSYGFI